MNKQNRYQKNDVVSIWDTVAQNYKRESYWGGKENQANFQVLLSHIGNPMRKRIIEIGCGSGFTSIALAQRGAKCAILDISPISLESAVSNFVAAGLPVPEHYLADALDSNIPSNTFDIVWNGGVIEHFFDEGKEKLILEMFRIAKPSGQVIIMVPNRWCWQFQLIQAWQKWRKTWAYGFEDDMSPRDLKHMCVRLGFNDYTVYAFNTILGWRWIPKLDRVIKMLGWETLGHHCQRSWMGFVSVLVIRKQGD